MSVAFGNQMEICNPRNPHFLPILVCFYQSKDLGMHGIYRGFTVAYADNNDVIYVLIKSTELQLVPLF